VALGIVDELGLSEQEESGAVAGRAFVADGVDQIIQWYGVHRVADNDQLECGAENQIEEEGRRVDRVNAELGPPQHGCDALKSRILGADYQYVLPGIGHQLIIPLNPVKTRNMLGFVDLGWWWQPPIRLFCAVFSPGF